MNYARDYANNIELELAGWRVIRIWECEIRTKANQRGTLENLFNLITGNSHREYDAGRDPEEDSIAAEPQESYESVT